LILGGSIPADELNELLSCVSGVWGVKKIENPLKVQSQPIEMSQTAQQVQNEG